MSTSGRIADVLPAVRGAVEDLGSVAVPTTERDRERRRIAALCAPFAVLLVVAGVYPLLEVVRISVSVERFETVGFTLSAYRTLVTDPYYRRVAFNTLWFAALTTLVSVALAVPIAHALEKYDLPGEGLFVTLVSFPISLPGIVAAFMMLVLFGNNGVLTNVVATFAGANPTDVAVAVSVPGLFLAFVYSMVPRATLILRGTYAEVEEAAEEAAQALGATPLQTFRYVTFPQIRPGITGALILTFRTGLAIFGTLIVIQTLLVWTLQLDRELSAGAFPVAGAMATVYFVFVFGFTALGLRYTSAEVGL
ncbi:MULTISPECIES: ABC transporter permease [Haloarcula]|uniref:ABC transporter permease n=1 Tax=Haloarcula pellucida TaxID=1427151 RepID=A0A830GKD6_9EURY|nr:MULTISPECIES: ABC transporter permease subunit [Halomicroarcula]MBX0348770.1 ABC transporter permease subunit [Halomicroarcula pellucida]MDS0278538.1 ABC transporter permease subunit [Halomicroarcula sp. S1AR25-4]GGN91874.1 ABC transporter permease [Halomicroarcula pellucida]